MRTRWLPQNEYFSSPADRWIATPYGQAMTQDRMSLRGGTTKQSRGCQTSQAHGIGGRRQRGFSLVEVTVALGIFSFALVAILGMLPVGLNTADSAFRQSSVANIMTSAAASIRGMRWDSQGGGYYTDEWLGTGGGRGVSLPITNQDFFIGDDGSIMKSADKDKAAYRMEIRTEGAMTWPNVHRAIIKVSWPAGAEVPAGTETAVVYAKLPPQQ